MRTEYWMMRNYRRGNRTIRSQDKYEFIYHGVGKRERNHQLDSREMDDYDAIFVKRLDFKWIQMVSRKRDAQAYRWRLG